MAAFIRQGLAFTIRDDLAFDEQLTDEFDGLFIDLNDLNIIICVLYRSPSFNSISEFTENLNKKVEFIKKEKKDIIIAGDLNIDLLKYSSHHLTTEFLDQLFVNNIIPKTTLPTRITEKSSTLIDHIYTNIDNTKCIAGTLRTAISDHYSNCLILKTTRNTCLPQYVTYRAINDHLIENLNNKLSECNWDEIYKCTDVNLAYDLFVKKLLGLVNDKET